MGRFFLTKEEIETMQNRFSEDAIEELAAKYQAGTLTAEEKAHFDAWYLNFQDTEFAHSEATNPEGVKKRMYGHILQQMGAESAPVKRWRIQPALAGMAAAIALVISGIWFYSKQPNVEPITNDPTTTYKKDIEPASAGATLTLADGKTIRLTDAGNGELAQEAGVTISKSADGQLIYEIGQTGQSQLAQLSNTLSTARGQTYQVKLPDGSKVWLNAASSLTYSASLMEQGKRVVTLRGEGYFEIARDEKHPFIVKTNRQEVEVLGTHFNVNAYADEKTVKTTLLKGAVRVVAVASGESGRLSPGQSIAVSAASLRINKKANLQEAVAWKEGRFQYNQIPIEELMRQVEKWYDVEIEYTGQIPDKKYVGSISRTLPLQKFLDILSYTGLKFKTEGRKIIVAP